MEITICDGKKELAVFDALKVRAGEVDTKVTAQVQAIIADVKARGDAALRDYALRFDKFGGDCFEVPREEIEAAYANCDEKLKSALHRATDNIKRFHERQKQQSWLTTEADGVILGQRVRGLRRVGVYVPYGTAPLPSSVLMNVIPAKIAEVKEIIMVTPPWQGKADQTILAAAHIAGVDRVFLLGSAWAMAALAFGTETVPQVDKIVGPANIYGAMAKKLLYGTVDIDMIAGPSEILVVADKTANPAWLAADLLSQAEHDVLAGVVLLSTSQNIAERTVAELERQLESLPRKEIATEALRNNAAILVCESMERAIALANAYAPEHLELCVENPLERLGEIENAGSVFLGHYTPESVGDYYAGPNHVLPTGGTPRFFSPLSVDDVAKKVQFVHYTRPALAAALGDIATIAEAEFLRAHANAARIRFEVE
ncbi:MAG: histidinol dehydrogenase [Oscillospiraceae bacterium]|jgi:histidinol dehydrogenase|nr:histidinol dehydrogenase [Oscillospiraceae bacterium]